MPPCGTRARSPVQLIEISDKFPRFFGGASLHRYGANLDGVKLLISVCLDEEVSPKPSHMHFIPKSTPIGVPLEEVRGPAAP